MGGSRETKISGLRLHISNKNVHIHDDSKGLKFETLSSNFKTEINDAFKSLKSQDGLIKIDGKGKVGFCLVKDGRSMYSFLTDKQSTKQKLESFVRTC